MMMGSAISHRKEKEIMYLPINKQALQRGKKNLIPFQIVVIQEFFSQSLLLRRLQELIYWLLQGKAGKESLEKNRKLSQNYYNRQRR